MIRKIVGLLASITLLAGLGLTGCASPSPTATEAAAEMSEPMTSGEILGVLQAINMGEIQHAQLALERSENPEVRETANLILEEHQMMSEKIPQVAQSLTTVLKETPLSQGITTQANAIEENLQQLSGTEFDRQFLRDQIRLHEISVDIARDDLMENAENPEVRQLVTQAIDSLERHLVSSREALQRLEQQPVSSLER